MDAEPSTASNGSVRWLDLVSPEERRALLQIHPLRSWAMVLGNWALVFAAMALVAAWPNPLTVVAALFVIGARQLGMAIVMHEASHRTMFRTRGLNDWVGNWLAAYPVWADVGPYRAYHLVHHAKTGTAEDPDLGLAAPFPITKESFRRKVWRDLSGQTGWKQAKAVFRRDVGLSGKPSQRTMGMNRGEQPDVGWHKLLPVATTNLILLGVLAVAGYAWLYLLWVVAWLTTYRLVTRIRAIAEHGMVPDNLDPLRNTRTTLASWWERLLLAPNHVNYHLEHHLMMTVPAYNLRRFHRVLNERGVLDRSPIASGYAEVLRLATSRTAGR
jgi:fatty acid desaturase